MESTSKQGIGDDMRIAILAHWHTGSSLLARQLAMCGMWTGNARTHWTEECEGPCEHGYLNMIGDQLLQEVLDPQDACNKIKGVLREYILEARKEEEEIYGVKITHALQDKCWPVFIKAFDEAWGPETVYIVTTRHPFAIIKSVANNINWPPNRVVDSIRSTDAAACGLRDSDRTAYGIYYPHHWEIGYVKGLVEFLGLSWNKEAEELYDSKRMRLFNELELELLGRVVWGERNKEGS